MYENIFTGIQLINYKNDDQMLKHDEIKRFDSTNISCWLLIRQLQNGFSQHKKWSFLLGICSVNVTKSTGNSKTW